MTTTTYIHNASGDFGTSGRQTAYLICELEKFADLYIESDGSLAGPYPRTDEIEELAEEFRLFHWPASEFLWQAYCEADPICFHDEDNCEDCYFEWLETDEAMRILKEFAESYF